MPWHIEDRGGRQCVVKDGETEPVTGGCHPTLDEAQSHMRALYASEPAVQGFSNGEGYGHIARAAAEQGAPTCACGGSHADVGVAGVRVAASLEPLDAQFPVPPYPPREWFHERPDWLTPETKIGVDDMGRVAGYFYNKDQCLLYRADACPKPSPTFYAAFHQSDVVCEDGAIDIVGVIGNTHGHANPYASVDVAQRHYQDPSAQLIACRAYDDEHGGFILGAVVPNATYGDVALIRRSPLSGDWRYMPPTWWSAHGIQASVVRACEGFDCIGPTLVTRPGLPVIRRFNDSQRAAAVLGGVGGIQLEDEEQFMAETAPVVVHQHFHDSPPGPQPARTAADATSPTATPVESPAEEQQETGDLDAVKQAVADLTDRVAAIEQFLQQAQDAQMAALEASAEPLPEALQPA